MSVPSPTSRSGRRAYISLWDLFWAAASPAIALYVRDPSLVQSAEWHVLGLFWFCSTSFALFAFFAFKLQDGMTRYFSVQQAFDVLEVTLFTELMTFLTLFSLTRLDGIPRSIPLTHGFLLLGGLLAARIIVRIVFSEDDVALEHDLRRERVIIIGANSFTAAFIQLLNAYSPAQNSVLAVVDDKAELKGKTFAGARVLGAPAELKTLISEFAIHGISVSRVVIAGESNVLSPPVLDEIASVCKTHRIDLSFLPRMIGLTEPQRSGATVVAKPKWNKPSIPLPPYFRLKRAIDIFASIALLVLLLPLLIIASVLVILDVGRPVLFWQERLGWKGRPFLIYKFRTLAAPYDVEGNLVQKERQPSMIGRLLRATRIDELPQLFNVLLGDMSLIGPRPLLPEDQPGDISLRLAVRPGITGWAQVNGGKLVTKEEKEEFDNYYVRNASLLQDLQIAVLTLKLLMHSRTSSREALADTDQVRIKGNDALEAGNLPSVVAPESSPPGSLLAGPPQKKHAGAK